MEHFVWPFQEVLFKSAFHNSSANRGACKQNCRKKYTVIDQESGFEIELDNEFMMSPKDLCTLDFLDQVIDTGVKVLKIEGRGRAPEYVATVIRTYREAIDAYYAGSFSKQKVTEWMKALHKVYNRGFWSGYYLGQKLGSGARLMALRQRKRRSISVKAFTTFQRPVLVNLK